MSLENGDSQEHKVLTCPHCDGILKGNVEMFIDEKDVKLFIEGILNVFSNHFKQEITIDSKD